MIEELEEEPETVSKESPLGEVMSVDTSDLGEKRAHTPVLPTLRQQQAQLRDRLRSGLDSRQDVLVWAHAAAAVSAGQLPDEWFVSILNDRWRLGACLRSQQVRDALLDDAAQTESQAQAVREDIIQNTLSPAYQSALRVLERQANDFLDDREGINHVDRQKFLALRPRLHQYAVTQHKALLWSLGHSDFDPIKGRDVAAEWADYVGYACGGRGDRIFSQRVTTPLGEWFGALIDDTEEYLITLLADDVLPVMNRTLRAVALEAEELPAQTRVNSAGGNIS